jgi:hypothetical protein
MTLAYNDVIILMVIRKTVENLKGYGVVTDEN